MVRQKAEALDNFRKGWDFYKMNAFQRELTHSYQSRALASEKADRVYDILKNNGYSYSKRIKKVQEEISGQVLDHEEKSYVSEALNIVYQRINSRAKGKFDRSIKDRIDTSRQILKIMDELSEDSYGRIEERYEEISEKERPQIIYPVEVRPAFYHSSVIKVGKRFRRTGTMLAKLAAGIAGGVILAGVSAFVGWSLGSEYTEKKLLPQLNQKISAASSLEEKLIKTTETVKTLEEENIDVKTRNLELQERNLQLAKDAALSTGTSKYKDVKGIRPNSLRGRGISQGDLQGKVVVEFDYVADKNSQNEAEVKQFGDIRVKLIPADKSKKIESDEPAQISPPTEVKPSKEVMRIPLRSTPSQRSIQENPRIPKSVPQTRGTKPPISQEVSPPKIPEEVIPPTEVKPLASQKIVEQEQDIIDTKFNAYGRYLGKKGREQWKQGKPIESLITGAGSWISLGGEILRHGYEPVAEVAGGAIGVIASPSREHNQEGWRKGIQKGEDTARFFYRNWWGGPNWNHDFAKAGEFVSLQKLDFGTKDDPFIKNDKIPGLIVRVGADIAAGAIIENNVCKSGGNGHRSASNGGGVNGGTTGSPGGIPR